MSQVLESIKTKLAVIEEQKKAMVAELQTEFPKIFEELFAKSKLIDSFSWTQYTPYFNDGETCEFHVYADYPEVNGENIDDVEWYDWKIKFPKYENEIDKTKVNVEECNIVLEFIKAIESIPEEFMQGLFGDHAKVTIFRDGSVETDVYDHD